MAKSLQDYTEIMDKFYDARQWHHNDPNQLLSSLHIELGELAEHFQWQSSFKQLSETERTELGYEFVDVFIYFLRLAENSGIDIEKYFDEKLPKLEKKFPLPDPAQGNLTREEKIRLSKAHHDQYRKAGKNILY